MTQGYGTLVRLKSKVNPSRPEAPIMTGYFEEEPKVGHRFVIGLLDDFISVPPVTDVLRKENSIYFESESGSYRLDEKQK